MHFLITVVALSPGSVVELPIGILFGMKESQVEDILKALPHIRSGIALTDPFSPREVETFHSSK